MQVSSGRKPVVVAAAVVLALAVIAVPWLVVPAVFGVLWALPLILLISWAVGVWRMLERIQGELNAVRQRMDALEIGMQIKDPDVS